MNKEQFVIGRVGYAYAVWHITESPTTEYNTESPYTMPASDGTTLWVWEPHLFLGWNQVRWAIEPNTAKWFDSTVAVVWLFEPTEEEQAELAK